MFWEYGWDGEYEPDAECTGEVSSDDDGDDGKKASAQIEVQKGNEKCFYCILLLLLLKYQFYTIVLEIHLC